ncbi:MAG: thiamine ABC transporter substrate-binding protein [Ardenticatenaceae bacterium]|nr:thiamine ABC transporter substrate-binding protein [Ardenticatenaceae bacterium]MCB8947446.1 thiamine ABC transporter substrate-binding protein [Ardenticatenaceae bacterium]
MKRLFLVFILLATAVSACGSDEPDVITLMTHDSFAISEDTLAQFEADNGVTVELLPSGDTGAALNQAILAKEAPLADVFFGVDNTFMGRALNAEIFTAYDSALLSEIPDALKLDAENRLLPVDYGDVCLNYDKAWFAENALPLPQSLSDLTDPIYAGLLVVENPATSSPGLAFLLATIAEFGEDGYLEYWADLRANDVLVTNGWEDAYYGSFTVASDGERPLVVSYASSPPAEVIYADPPVDEAPSASLVAPGMCFRQIEFVGILAGTEKQELAEKLIDFILGQTFQEDMPLNMFVYPANENAELPAEFVEWTQLPEETAVLAPETIDENREQWIEAWTEVVLR